MASLSTALGALKANQAWLDVLGNNIANANTPGFKTSRALFSDYLSKTFTASTAPTGNLGGKNPGQVGLGVRLGSVDKILTQGALNFTGRTFDLAVLGEGYFSVSNGSQQLYSRVGTFGLDSTGDMVDLRTGYKVLDSAGQALNIDTGAVIPSEASSLVSFSGNLPAEVTGPLAEVVASAGELHEGTAASLTGATAGPFAIPTGQTWTMDIAVDGGVPQTVSVTSTTGSVTALEVVNAINAAIDDVTATVAPGGEVAITTDKLGEDASLKVSPGAAGTDLAGALGMSVSLVSGTEFMALGTTDINDLVVNQEDYGVGEVIELSGTMTDGTPVAASFQYGVDGTTITDLVTFIDGLYTDATVTYDETTGQIVATADASGEAGISLTIGDGSSQTGTTAWALHALAIEVNGAGPDTFQTSSEVFDEAGTPHVLTYTYERQDDLTWNLTVSSDEANVTLFGETVTDISFANDGSLLTPPTTSFQVQFENQGLMEVDLNFGSINGFDGMTQFGGTGTPLVATANGFTSGELGSIAVNVDGTIDGVFTNGQVQSLGSVGIATFENPAGLSDEGNGYLATTGNSGVAVIGPGANGNTGEVVGGALEQSNVDSAEQFVRLIEAQRGFQANARVISTINDLLAEVVNII